jgi:hypothetical protein
MIRASSDGAKHKQNMTYLRTASFFNGIIKPILQPFLQINWRDYGRHGAMWCDVFSFLDLRFCDFFFEQRATVPFLSLLNFSVRTHVELHIRVRGSGSIVGRVPGRIINTREYSRARSQCGH